MKNFHEFKAVMESYVQMKTEARGSVVKFQLQGSRSDFEDAEEEIVDFFNHSGIEIEGYNVDNRGNVTIELVDPKDAKEVKSYIEDEMMVRGSVKT